MKTILAACGCSTGNIRANNEDNFYFNGDILPAENRALSTVLTAEIPAEQDFCAAVFDGMGGEQFGEWAAFTAARQMKEGLAAGGRREGGVEEWLEGLTLELNDAVFRKSRELLTRHMGSTLAGLYLQRDRAWAFNLGDSRVYLARGGALRQLSVDHVDTRMRPSGKGKGSLTQYLGIDEEEFIVEPSICASDVCEGDRFLLCSDGLSDMVADGEILAVLSGARSAEQAVEKLIALALAHGGKDNVTVIVCTVTEDRRPDEKAAKTAAGASRETPGRDASPAPRPEEAAPAERGAKKKPTAPIAVIAAVLVLALIAVLAVYLPKRAQSAPAPVEAPAAETAEPAEETAEPAEETAAPVEETAAPLEETPEPAEEAAAPDETAPEAAAALPAEAAGYIDVIAGSGFSACLRADGTVCYAGDPDTDAAREVPGWTGIVRLEYLLADSLGPYLVGFREDGSVTLAAAWEPFDSDQERWVAEDTASLRDVRKLHASFCLLLALHGDGTVSALSLGEEAAQVPSIVAGWRDVVDLAESCGLVVGLLSDGSVVTTDPEALAWQGSYFNGSWGDPAEWHDVEKLFCDANCGVYARRSDGVLLGMIDDENWRDIDEIYFGIDSMFGLRRDGTVACSCIWLPPDDPLILQVSAWRDVRKLCCKWYSSFPVGLKADGTVAAVTDGYGGEPYGEWDFTGWSDVRELWGGALYTIGLRDDGSLLVTGGASGPDPFYDRDVCRALEEAAGWTDVVKISVQEDIYADPSSFLILALRSDGTVAAAGDNSFGQLDIA